MAALAFEFCATAESCEMSTVFLRKTECEIPQIGVVWLFLTIVGPTSLWQSVNKTRAAPNRKYCDCLFQVRIAVKSNFTLQL